MSVSSWPKYDDDMINGVIDVLKSGKVNQWTGKYVKQFERDFAKYHNMQYAVAVSNGTVALEIALRALDIGNNDDVIVSSRSFIASASCVSLVGGNPIFCDVDINSQNMTIENILDVITENTKAIILVHLAGFPCEMDPIIEYANKNNIYVIEDCSQAHGAKYNDKYVGTFGDISAWSFCQDKIISTGGEGGMVMTNNEIFYKKMWSYKDHGKNIDNINNNLSNNYKWLHDTLGNNYRMTEMQAIIGICSLNKLQEWVNIRRNNANKLDKLFEKYNIRTQKCPHYHSYYKYYFFVDNYRDKIISDLLNNNIIATVGSCGELYKEKVFNKNIIMPISKKLFDISIMLQIDHTIDIEYNIKIIDNILSNYHPNYN